MVTFSFYRIQARESLERGIAHINDKQDRDCTEEEYEKFGAITQGLKPSTSFRDDRSILVAGWFAKRNDFSHLHFDTGNFRSSATFNMSTLTRGSPRKPQSARWVNSGINCFT